MSVRLAPGRPALVCLLGRLGAVAASRAWLAGLVLNLVLALLYLLVSPLAVDGDRDWAILVGSYFATFVLADTAATNALGIDAARVAKRLQDGQSLGTILIRKNLVLLLAVGVPVLALTAVITLRTESAGRLLLTLPAVTGPAVAWLGLGNLVSVLLPVPSRPMSERWSQRRDLPSTGRWLLGLGLPYALCLLIDPANRLGVLALHALGLSPSASLALLAAALTATGVLVWAALTAVALEVARQRQRRRLVRLPLAVQSSLAHALARAAAA